MRKNVGGKIVASQFDLNSRIFPNCLFTSKTINWKTPSCRKEGAEVVAAALLRVEDRHERLSR